MTAVEKRRKLVEEEIGRYRSLLSSRPDVMGIILFGSTATRKFHEYSDIDIVVIQNTQAPFMERLRNLRHLLQPKVATDILVYTPQEVARMTRDRPFLRQEILGEGRILYERKRGTLALLRA